MFDNQADALGYALASRPRGLKCGDTVKYMDHHFEVVAVQQWLVKNTPHAVGLVWGGRCSECESDWYQLTETRVGTLAETCSACAEETRIEPPTLDTVVANNLMADTGFEIRFSRPRGSALRYGATERHIMDVIDNEYAEVDSTNEVPFVARCAELLPPPNEGKRDQRVFVIKRAVQSLAKRKNGPIALEMGRVIFCK